MAQPVREIMAQQVRTCPTTAPLVDAARIMRDDDVGDVIVVKDDGTVCGIVTDRDVTIRAVAEGRDVVATSVDEVCSHRLVTVSPDDDTEQAARLMRQHAVRRLPVTVDGKPVGAISLGDLAIERDPQSALAEISAQPGNE
ncbi:MAG TPA: CBS domain-containing protein [Egibacteraceae bacterium]|nr:CBS domain-containing protein [Actinomycetota bacterium]HWB72195.1 CBS domain-containing protein [Egibacteraceae bacterium]